MSNVIQLDRFKHITYLEDDEGIFGIRIEKFGTVAEFLFNGYIELDWLNIDLNQEELKMVMVMWLLMVDPDLIKHDEEEANK
jgi:hypothetical protein